VSTNGSTVTTCDGVSVDPPADVYIVEPDAELPALGVAIHIARARILGEDLLDQRAQSERSGRIGFGNAP
jgi:hypothetical protein